MHLRSYFSCVFPTCTTRAGGVEDSSLYASNSDVPGGVFTTHGWSFVPLPFSLEVDILYLNLALLRDIKNAKRF